MLLYKFHNNRHFFGIDDIASAKCCVNKNSLYSRQVYSSLDDAYSYDCEIRKTARETLYTCAMLKKRNWENWSVWQIYKYQSPMSICWLGIKINKRAIVRREMLEHLSIDPEGYALYGTR